MGFDFDPDAKTWTVNVSTPGGRTENYTGEHLISSIPIRELVAQIEPRLPENALAAAQALRYRDF